MLMKINLVNDSETSEKLLVDVKLTAKRIKRELKRLMLILTLPNTSVNQLSIANDNMNDALDSIKLIQFIIEQSILNKRNKSGY
jgi:hypothetical protein